MRAVYIAGPFRGVNAWTIEQNIHRAEALAAQVCRLGVLAVCPHTMFRNFQGLLQDAFFLDATLELMRRCDAVVLTDDWEQSGGARCEVVEAGLQGLPVFYSLQELAEWVG